MRKFIYFIENIFFIIHLALGTRRFGINNKLWCKDHSIFSVPFYKAVWSLPTRIRMMKKRAFMGFLPQEEAGQIFPEYYRKNYKDK